MKIKYELVEGGRPPVRGSRTAAGWDLYARVLEHIWLYLRQRTIVPLGVRVAIPKGYVGLLTIRSGLAKEGVMLANGVGVIDPDYRGEVCALLHAYAKNMVIMNGERIAQLVVVKQPELEWIEEKLDDTPRGKGGFGSTGF